MKSVFSPALALYLMVVAAGAGDLREQPVASGPLHDRVADARRIVRRGGRNVEVFKGMLISDPAGRYVRFDSKDRGSFEASYDHVVAMHYEMESTRLRPLLNAEQTAHYLTIFALSTTGQEGFATFRLPARDAAAVLDSLETDTGLRINRTLPKRSFLGLPIRVAVGDAVVVTDKAGQTTTGPITHLSARTLVVNGSSPAEREFVETGIRRISLTLPNRRIAPPNAKWWAGIGAVVGGLYGGTLSGAAGVLEGAAVFGAMWGVIGNGVNAVAAAPADTEVYTGPP